MLGDIPPLPLKRVVPGHFKVVKENLKRVQRSGVYSRLLASVRVERNRSYKVYSGEENMGYFGSDAGSCSRLIDFVYHSTLGFGVIKRRRDEGYFGSFMAMLELPLLPPPYSCLKASCDVLKGWVVVFGTFRGESHLRMIK